MRWDNVPKLGWTKEQLEEFLARAKRDLKDPKIKAYFPREKSYVKGFADTFLTSHVMYGRKPGRRSVNLTEDHTEID
ncbi:hypothetical protein PG994_007719 [Apiospora phragmitis]|uniref:Uncharacterized protein n=1 Tax=Apiospora phragmitis TaxID=2905665 RepID=A0ABR1UU48_9PEZI